VVRNGVNFEAELRKRNGSSTKFAFLLPKNPYYPYYKRELFAKLDPAEADKLRKLRAAELNKKQEEKKVTQRQTTVKKLSLKERIQQEMKLIRIPKEMYIQQQPIDKYTVNLPQMIKPSQIDLMKLTAQFVARNGKKFLSMLSSKEANNAEFEFLDPVHPIFPYFQKLVNAYCTCIVPPDKTLETVKSDTDLSTLVLKTFGAAEWMRREEESREEKAADEEEERLQMQLIDWHRFVVLETLDFDPGEVYPAPARTIQEINVILSTENRGDINVTLADDVRSDEEMDMDIDKSSGDEAQEMEMDMEDSDGEEEPAPMIKEESVRDTTGDIVNDDDLAAVPKLESQEELRLRQQVEQELKRRAADMDMVESPFTGDMIPLAEISEHIRIMLLNPKWKEQKEILLDKMRSTSLADNREIVKNLHIFSKRRQELTGGTGKPKEQILTGRSSGWDGHQDTRAQANAAALQRDVAQEGKRTAEEMEMTEQVSKKQAETDAKANRLVPQPPPQNFVGTYNDGDSNPTKKRKIVKGLKGDFTFHLPGGTVAKESVDLGENIGELKKKFASALGHALNNLVIVGPGESVLDDSKCLGDYGMEGGSLFIKLQSDI